MDPREATMALLATRSEHATVCPSEVARVVAGEDGAWREAMPQVHAAVDALVDEGAVRLSWKGRPMAMRAGPYRIARALADAASEGCVFPECG